MKKKHDFREVSEKRCKKCHKRLKLNLLEKKPAAELCFTCYDAEQRKARGQAPRPSVMSLTKDTSGGKDRPTGRQKTRARKARTHAKT